jgi:hypothetical protein
LPNLRAKSVTELNLTAHDPDTIGMLRRVLEDAWATLSQRQQTQANKSIMAQELLKLAADGERDPTRLCELAVLTVEAPGLKNC